MSGFHRIVDAEYWGAHGFPHAEAKELREKHPVWHYEGDVVDPFWLVTRRDDIVEISKRPDLWTSTQRTTIEQPHGEPSAIRSIVQMDPPEHGKYRAILQSWLSPSNVRRLEGRLKAISRELVDSMAEKNEVDFVPEVASIHPLRMICELLGIPRSEEGRVLQLAKFLFGANDPEFSVGRRQTAIEEIMGFCKGLAESRQATPTDDLASAIANATIDEAPIGLHEVMSHLLVLVAAGHETTASAISGGLLALIENPGELEKLKADPSLIPTAVDEIVRWVTPTTNFLRTATADAEIRGVKVSKGDDVCLSYASANRDETVFDAPFEFRVDRRPNPHLGFGIGPHGCVGQILARLEIKALLEELIPRIEGIEPTAEPIWVKAIWVCSLKHLPIRYELRAA